LKITLDDLFKIKNEALDLFPVVIVGERLVKFGFVHRESFVYFELAPIYMIQKNTHWYFMKHEVKINEDPVLYIYQLQNLFYALSRQELHVK